MNSSYLLGVYSFSPLFPVDLREAGHALYVFLDRPIQELKFFTPFWAAIEVGEWISLWIDHTTKIIKPRTWEKWNKGRDGENYRIRATKRPTGKIKEIKKPLQGVRIQGFKF